jgi:DNA-binding beta-propeller fold protein YncE
VDSHGATLTKHARYLWVADRAANRIIVVNTRSDTVVNEIALAGSVSPDPAPDLMGISPSGNRVYVSLHGPAPLTANVFGVNNAVGSTPGSGSSVSPAVAGPAGCRRWPRSATW